MDDPFDSPNQLLNWAKGHIETIRMRDGGFNSGKPYELFREVDPKTSETCYRARITKRLPVEISLFAFDAINALRASLDHAAYASAELLGHSTAGTKFPFGDTEAEAKANATRNKSQVPDEITKLMLSFKPYKDGNKTLWGMNKVRNLKHHRFLAPVAAVVQSRVFKGGHFHSPSIEAAGAGFRMPAHEWDRKNQTLTYLRVPIGVEGETNSEISVNVAFDDIPPFSSKLAVPLFVEMLDISTSIVGAIEAETRRLKGS